jgi:hypothetical protein
MTRNYKCVLAIASSGNLCLEYQGAVIIANPFCKVHVRIYLLAINSPQSSSKNWDLVIVLPFAVELDVLGAVKEVLATPFK